VVDEVAGRCRAARRRIEGAAIGSSECDRDDSGSKVLQYGDFRTRSPVESGAVAISEEAGQSLVVMSMSRSSYHRAKALMPSLPRALVL
jgi:hypothetical protein